MPTPSHLAHLQTGMLSGVKSKIHQGSKHKTKTKSWRVEAGDGGSHPLTLKQGECQRPLHLHLCNVSEEVLPQTLFLSPLSACSGKILVPSLHYTSALFLGEAIRKLSVLKTFVGRNQKWEMRIQSLAGAPPPLIPGRWSKSSAREKQGKRVLLRQCGGFCHCYHIQGLCSGGPFLEPPWGSTKMWVSMRSGPLTMVIWQ